jgi:hypothetical protein
MTVATECIHLGDETSAGQFKCSSPNIIHLDGYTTSEVCCSCPYKNKPKVTLPTKPAMTSLTQPADCPHRVRKIGDRKCQTCGAGKWFELFECSLYGECSDHKVHRNPRGCTTCIALQENNPEAAERLKAQGQAGQSQAQATSRIDANPPNLPRKRKAAKKWAYGITTVPMRLQTTFPLTLASLSAAGFDTPRLFVDGAQTGQTDRVNPANSREIIDADYRKFGLEVTTHYPKIRAYGNWILALGELYLRNPNMDRYAIFQDDVIAYRNLRAYLDSCDYPDNGYWNLYSYPPPKGTALPNSRGWHLSNQKGKGALGLVFSLQAVRTLLLHQHLVDRARDPNDGWKKIDGGVVDAMLKAGGREYVHNPSLVQHIGSFSSLHNRPTPHKPAPTFLGESYDALALLEASPV